jgi:hypothetical protein
MAVRELLKPPPFPEKFGLLKCALQTEEVRVYTHAIWKSKSLEEAIQAMQRIFLY